jgi:light-regulated signal transduction histidine kinase (bacteriophytochrome)
MISSFLTKLSLKYDDLLDEKGKQYINFAVDGAQRMRQTILDLLQYSRVGKGNTQPEWIDMDMMMNSVCLLHKQSIEELGAKIVWHKLPRIFSFQTPMLHIMNNLIGNALKYHRPFLPPLIHVRAMKKGELWQFEVEDNGLGIEKEYQQKIFVLFQRVHSETTGSGIGLAVVRKVVESLDGKVWVESEPDKGSIFYFTIKEEKPGADPVVQPN